MELRKKIEALDREATGRRILNHKLEALKAQLGHSQKHVKECSGIERRRGWLAIVI